MMFSFPSITLDAMIAWKMGGSWIMYARFLVTANMPIAPKKLAVIEQLDISDPMEPGLIQETWTSILVEDKIEPVMKKRRPGPLVVMMKPTEI